MDGLVFFRTPQASATPHTLGLDSRALDGWAGRLVSNRRHAPAVSAAGSPPSLRSRGHRLATELAPEFLHLRGHLGNQAQGGAAVARLNKFALFGHPCVLKLRMSDQ